MLVALRAGQSSCELAHSFGRAANYRDERLTLARTLATPCSAQRTYACPVPAVTSALRAVARCWLAACEDAELSR